PSSPRASPSSVLIASCWSLLTKLFTSDPAPTRRMTTLRDDTLVANVLVTPSVFLLVMSLAEGVTRTLGRHARRQRPGHPLGQRHHQEEDGDDQGDAQDGHRRRHLADHQVSTAMTVRSEEHTSELQSRVDLVCRLLLEKKILGHKQTIDETQSQ